MGMNSCFENLNEHNDLARYMTAMLESVKLPEESIVHEQCIYRVPHKIRQPYQQAYTPRVVSIGPIHTPFRPGGDNKLKPMEEFKQYLKSFLNGTQLSVVQCVSELKEWETSIRRCYAEPIQHNSDDFLRMILSDACFIIEHFLRYYSFQDWIKRDPLFLKPWLASDVALDLILLENQLPFFVLEGLYNLAIAPHVTADLPSFVDIAFNYFRTHNQQNIQPKNVRVQHFTDLLRTFMLPAAYDHGLQDRRVDIVEHLYSASQLLEAGLAFKVSPSKCLLDLKFHKGVLTMPCFKVHCSTETFIRNIIAFEQCHHPSSPYITEYVKILAFLINIGKDVNVLVDKKIIVNLLGDGDDAVATMVNNLCSNLTLPHINSEYRLLCDQLNSFYENPRNKYKAIFIHDYFNTPWKIASTIAAIVLLLLTLIQTVCSIMALFKNCHNFYV